MTEAAIESEVRRIIAQVAPDVDPAAIQPEEDIRRSLGIDSFDHLRILTAISERFSIAIPEGDHGRLRTLMEMVGYISDHTAK
jgi:acyl carrier protein